MKTFAVKILASDRIFFEGRCKMAVLTAMDGQLGIMAGHADVVAALEVGELRIQMENDKWIRAVSGKGIMQFVNNRMTVLAEFVEAPDEIDEKRARAAKRKAEEQLRQRQSIQEYHQSKAALGRAMARLKEKNKI